MTKLKKLGWWYWWWSLGLYMMMIVVGGGKSEVNCIGTVGNHVDETEIDTLEKMVTERYEDFFKTMPKMNIKLGQGSYQYYSTVLLDLSGYSLIINTDLCQHSFCLNSPQYPITQSLEAQSDLDWNSIYPSINTTSINTTSINNRIKLGYVVRQYMERVQFNNSKSVITQLETPYKTISGYKPMLPFQNSVGVFGASPDALTTKPSIITQLFNSNAILNPILHLGPYLNNNSLHFNLGSIRNDLIQGNIIYFNIPRRYSTTHHARTPIWGFPNANLKLNHFNLGKLHYVALETKRTKIYVPHAAKQDLINAFNLPPQFPCHHTHLLPNLTLIIDHHHQLILHPSTYLQPLPNHPNQCQLYFDDTGDDPIVILPIGFFINNQIILDYLNNRIGIVSSQPSKLVTSPPPPLLPPPSSSDSTHLLFPPLTSSLLLLLMILSLIN